MMGVICCARRHGGGAANLNMPHGPIARSFGGEWVGRGRFRWFLFLPQTQQFSGNRPRWCHAAHYHMTGHVKAAPSDKGLSPAVHLCGLAQRSITCVCTGTTCRVLLSRAQVPLCRHMVTLAKAWALGCCLQGNTENVPGHSFCWPANIFQSQGREGVAPLMWQQPTGTNNSESAEDNWPV